MEAYILSKTASCQSSAPQAFIKHTKVVIISALSPEAILGVFRYGMKSIANGQTPSLVSSKRT